MLKSQLQPFLCWIDQHICCVEFIFGSLRSKFCPSADWFYWLVNMFTVGNIKWALILSFCQSVTNRSLSPSSYLNTQIGDQSMCQAGQHCAISKWWNGELWMLLFWFQLFLGWIHRPLPSLIFISEKLVVSSTNHPSTYLNVLLWSAVLLCPCHTMMAIPF